MLAVVIILVVSNVVTLALLLYWRLRAAAETVHDPEIASALAALTPTPATVAKPRRFISVEILNPIELAGSRGRVLGIAGSLAPGLTRRIVYDQIVKEMRRLFAARRVVADVHVHSIHPSETAAAKATAPTPPTVSADVVVTTPPSPPATPEPHTVDIAPGVVDDVDALAPEFAEDQRPV